MKKYTSLSSVFVFIVFFSSSCSIEKRVYRKGYTIEWSAAKKADLPVLIEKNVAPVLEKVQPRSSEMKAENTDIHMLLKLPYENSIVSGKTGNSSFNRITALKCTSINKTAKRAERKKQFKSGFKKVFRLIAPQDEAQLMPLAVASFVLGILSLVAYYGAFPLAVLAIIFGAISLSRIHRNPGAYRGYRMALTGLICGIIALAVITTIIVVL